MAENLEAEVAGLRIILSNVLARLVVLESERGTGVRERLDAISDECKLAIRAHHVPRTGITGDSWVRSEPFSMSFFKGITAT